MIIIQNKLDKKILLPKNANLRIIIDYNVNRVYFIKLDVALEEQAVYPLKRKTGWIRYLGRGLLAAAIIFTASNTASLEIKMKNNITVYKDNKTANTLT